MVTNKQSNGRDDRWSKSYSGYEVTLSELDAALGELTVADAELKILATKDATFPEFHSKGAAGMDLASSVDITLPPGKVCPVPTGLRMIIPTHFEGQIRARSSLAIKGVAIMNAPGTIDSDYRGEVAVIMINHGETNFEISKGDRIAQMIIAAVSKCKIVPVELSEWTKLTYNEDGRGEGGFGSTGK